MADSIQDIEYALKSFQEGLADAIRERNEASQEIARLLRREADLIALRSSPIQPKSLEFEIRRVGGLLAEARIVESQLDLAVAEGQQQVQELSARLAQVRSGQAPAPLTTAPSVLPVAPENQPADQALTLQATSAVTTVAQDVEQDTGTNTESSSTVPRPETTAPAPVPEYVAQQDPETQTWAVYDLSTGLPVSDRTGLTEQEAQLAAEDLSATGEVQQRPAPVNQTPEQQQAYEQQAAKTNTLRQSTLQARYKQPSNEDWRVRLSLALNSKYLYKDPAATQGILAPLIKTDGVIFPYTPTVETNYVAKYDTYSLPHSNYRGTYYRNSEVQDVSVRGTFTAQDTSEAAYLLATIHFFRSVTKMFYGQDSERGAPPPLVYLSGFGDWQFAGHPCVVSQFSYSLPSDVDYIRATNPNLYGTDLLNRRAAALSAPTQFSGSQARQSLLGAIGIGPGALPPKPAPNMVTQSVTNTSRATYVPTKIELVITLIPVQTRDQISKQFSLKEFANGELIKGGFW